MKTAYRSQNLIYKIDANTVYRYDWQKKTFVQSTFSIDEINTILKTSTYNFKKVEYDNDSEFVSNGSEEPSKHNTEKPE